MRIRGRRTAMCTSGLFAFFFSARENASKGFYFFSAFGKPARHLQQHVELRDGLFDSPSVPLVGAPPVLTPAGPG
jgi:hypothetical protein